jgi:hypothetical protein
MRFQENDRLGPLVTISGTSWGCTSASRSGATYLGTDVVLTNLRDSSTDAWTCKPKFVAATQGFM